MIFTFEMREDLRKVSGLSAREFNRRMKTAMRRTILFWHEKFAPKHFQRPAHSWYPEYSALVMKRRGRPLVESGSLRGRVLARRGEAEVSGTSTKATLRMPFGRPPKMTKEEIAKRIGVEMATKRVDYKTAERRVYSTAGYSAHVRGLFERLMPAVNTGEVQKLREFLRDQIANAMNETGPMRRRVMGGR